MIKETRFGWVDLSNLCRKGNVFDWDQSVGKSIPFCYKDITSEIIITEKPHAQYVYIDIPGYITHHYIYVGQLKKGQLGQCLGIYDYKYDIGDTIDNLIILDKFKRFEPHSHKYYRCQCSIDGYEWDLREEHIVNGVRCPVCQNILVMPGRNDIATTAPWMTPYFANPSDAKKYTAYSNKKVLFRCDRCGRQKEMLISDVARRGFSCSICSDGISYPNKFIYSLLSQLGIVFQSEARFEWAAHVPVSWAPEGKRMIYDIYIPSHNIIIENQGMQHYESNGVMEGVEQQIENDSAKRDVAIHNGVLTSNYIQLDCRYSTIEHIKRSVMKSNLPKLLNFIEDDIDWQQCAKFATSSMVFDAYKLHLSGVSVEDIAQKMQLHRDTIRRYIRTAKQLNLVCNDS